MNNKKNKISQCEIQFHMLNDLLIKIAEIYSGWHNTQQNLGVKDKLYRTEIHTIQTIGSNPEINLTKLAEKLGVRKPTAFEKIQKLINLGFIKKESSPRNDKEVRYFLTDKGLIVYNNHEENHRKFFKMFEKHFGSANAEKFLKEFSADADKFYRFIKQVKIVK